tara:strand:- start:319 stop:516 length:198 start_codon:yes stop_codon:yes gene_type:complete
MQTIVVCNKVYMLAPVNNPAVVSITLHGLMFNSLIQVVMGYQSVIQLLSFGDGVVLLAIIYSRIV